MSRLVHSTSSSFRLSNSLEVLLSLFPSLSLSLFSTFYINKQTDVPVVLFFFPKKHVHFVLHLVLKAD